MLFVPLGGPKIGRPLSVLERSATAATWPAQLRAAPSVVGRPMSRAWDQDEARIFVEALFAKHHGEIYAYLVRMLRDGDLAADLAQALTNASWERSAASSPSRSMRTR